MKHCLSNDAYGRLVSELYEDGETVTYRFDNSGELAAVIDSATGTTTKYYYDMAGRLMKYWDKSADNSHRMTYTYDAMDNLTRRRQVTNGDVFTTSYSYDDDNRLLKVTNGDTEKTYSYDSSGRLYRQLTKADGTTVLTETMTFHGGSDHPSENVTKFTSGQIKKYTSTYANGSLAYTYTYDNKGNILSVIDGTNTTSYVYDTMGQLVRANDQAAGKTWTWRYDAAGNITHHREYAYTTNSLGDALDTVHYLYADSKGWGDLLTSFDGQTITYDTIGNPLNDGTWRYTWEHGRQLASMEYITEEEEDEVTWRMTYDANGLRTGRTNGTNTYTYWYDGSGQLVRMQYGTVVLRIAYSLDGRPISISYNGETYYYVLNQQGDVMAIVDNSGNWVVKYTYDPWGNILTTTASNNTMYNTLAQYDPLRYRGYVYDRETGLYYLQSRYYDPEMGRFLNADGFTSTGQGLLGNNMFAYCLNNPVNGSDPCGTCLHHLNIWDDCEKCGGQTFGEKLVNAYTTIDSVYRQQQELDTEIRMEQMETLWDGAKEVYDAYNQSVELENERIRQQAQATIDIFTDRFSTHQKRSNTIGFTVAGAGAYYALSTLCVAAVSGGGVFIPLCGLAGATFILWGSVEAILAEGE